MRVNGHGPYLASGEVDDLKGVAEDAHSHELLAAVAAVLHERVDEALNNGALRRDDNEAGEGR